METNILDFFSLRKADSIFATHFKKPAKYDLDSHTKGFVPYTKEKNTFFVLGLPIQETCCFRFNL